MRPNTASNLLHRLWFLSLGTLRTKGKEDSA
jgi:hypothetical protein